MDKPIYLLVTPFFPSPETWRGAYCYDFVRALMRTGRYDVRVFVPRRGPDYDYQGVHVYRFPVWMLPSAILPFIFAWLNRCLFLRKLVMTGVSPKEVAVCHGHTAFFGVYPLAVRRENPRCLALLHHHDLASFGLNLGCLRHVWPHKFLNFLYLRRMHGRIDLHVFISRLVGRSFLSVPDASWATWEEYRRQMHGLGWLHGPRVRAYSVLRNGVDRRLFCPSAPRKSQGFVIGCVGNFNEGKGQLDLLRAVARLRDEFPAIEVRFVGSGETISACRGYAREAGLRVTFLEEMDHALLPEFYRGLDLFVLPSRWEGFGCVFAEAWACGIPFIACEGQGVDDLIPARERGVWLCKRQAPEDLAEKIRFFWHQRPGQCLSAPLDIDVLVSRFVGRVERLCARKRRFLPQADTEACRSLGKGRPIKRVGGRWIVSRPTRWLRDCVTWGGVETYSIASASFRGLPCARRPLGWGCRAIVFPVRRDWAA